VTAPVIAAVHRPMRSLYGVSYFPNFQFTPGSGMGFPQPIARVRVSNAAPHALTMSVGCGVGREKEGLWVVGGGWSVSECE
jgi:hypothetical protein